MGPEHTFDISTNKVTLPKLASDGSNWSLGTVRKPVELREQNGSFYKGSSLAPLSDKEVEDHEDMMDEWLQKEAQVREVIAAAVWKKLNVVHGSKGVMFETDLLARLQNSRLVEGEDMRIHLSNLTSIMQRLQEIGSPLTDEFFASCIRTSVSLLPSYTPLITTLDTVARDSGKPTTSEKLIWHLTQQADAANITENINKSNQAMLAAHAKSRGESSNSKGKSQTSASKKGEEWLGRLLIGGSRNMVENHRRSQ